MILNLDEETLAAKDLGKFDGVVAGRVWALIEQIVRQRAAETGRGRDDAFLMLGQHVDVDARSVVVAVRGSPERRAS